MYDAVIRLTVVSMPRKNIYADCRLIRIYKWMEWWNDVRHSKSNTGWKSETAATAAQNIKMHDTNVEGGCDA